MGLPPLARGARSVVMFTSSVVRPTPACAGSTVAARFVGVSVGAYPRLRGEHTYPDTRYDYQPGLPPLARGARNGVPLLCGVSRPTPACAGSTPRDRACTPCRTAYPRLRGEHSQNTAVKNSTSGLPPLARGARRGTVYCRSLRRPTPRLRGEHSRKRNNTHHQKGLPPLARGAHTGDKPQDDCPRPTPACAGSTPLDRGSQALGRAYPRLRGEHATAALRSSATPGLPPLARGAQPPRREARPVFGPTPACAGSTRAAGSAPFGVRAYPACAGSTVSMRVYVRGDGAYPRLRGEHA